MAYQSINLNKESGFTTLSRIYEENKHKPWKEWLEVKTIFPRPGKQGLVGLFRYKGTSSEEKNIVFVFKISQYINYLSQHELAVMDTLNSISNYCPHFCRSLGLIICDTNPEKKKGGNPFVCDSKYMVEKEVLLTEYLEKSYKFYNYIKSKNVPEHVLFSTIKQTLLAIAIAQRKCDFTHYDLHSNNIMMKRCSKNLVFLYVLDEQNQFCVPTHGCYPVIIDYGFSYAKGMEGGYLWQTLNHTEVGFISDRFDQFADPKLFLVTVSGEINEERNTPNSKKLKNITKNIYSKLKIDWNSGWDDDVSDGVTYYIMEKLSKYNNNVSNLFEEYDYYCLDIIQTLIVLPIQEQKTTDLKISYSTFLNEFSKIEKEISSPFFCLYILKGIVDSARIVRNDYTNKNTRSFALDYFKVAVLERIDSVSKFCTPKIHYEKLLCSLFCFTRGIEGLLYSGLEKRMNKKKKMYKSVPLKTPEKICAVIDLNIEDMYEFTEKTTVMVLDAVKNSCYELPLTKEQIDEINSYTSISRGPELYKYITQ